ncbi:MAG: hypothetical protein NVS3B25_14830 [Hymenobacter sp.]
MYTNIQHYFRFYLALALSILLAVGVRLQAAPLGAGTPAKEEVTAGATPGSQVGSPSDALAVR